MKKVAIIVVVIAIGVWIRMSNRGDDSEQVLEEAKAILVTMETYAANAEYLDAMVEREHQAAFDEYYTMARRRRAATFDDQGYLNELFHRLIKNCHRDGYPDVGKELAEMRAEYFGEEAP